MRKTFVSAVLFLSLFTFLLHAQTDSNLINPGIIIRDIKNDGNYLKPLVLFEESREAYLVSKFRNSYLNWSTYVQTFVGEHAKGLKDIDSLLSKLEDYVQPDLDTLQAVDAHDFIIQSSKNYRAVFFNEAHHMASQRIFIWSFLKEFYDNGFRYLASEICPYDASLQGRKYPELGDGYICEPCYADMIRTALALGYTVIPYEDTTETAFDFKKREKTQARNIAGIFEKDSSAKIIVHAGYQHIEEKINQWGTANMAFCFKELTGIDPLTINQTRFMEHGSRERELTLYKRALDKFAPDKPCVLVRPDGAAYVEPNYLGIVDIEVIHPRTKYIHGKPDWLIDAGREMVLIPKEFYLSKRYPLLIQAKYVNESERAVPIDQIVVRSGEGSYALALPKGSYEIRLMNEEGVVLKKMSKTVE